MTVACSFTLGPEGVHTIPAAASLEPATKKRAVEHPLLSAKTADTAVTSAKMHPHHRRHQRSYPVTFQPFGGKLISPHQQQHQPLHETSNYIVELHPGQASRPRLACDPPVLEIQIPTNSSPETSEHEDDGDDNTSWIQGSSAEGDDYEPFEHMESYKSQYLLSQKDLHMERQRSASLEHENARLKRHLFELQRRLFESQRKRQRTSAAASSSWDVPPVSVVRRAISTEESERKTLKATATSKREERV